MSSYLNLLLNYETLSDEAGYLLIPVANPKILVKRIDVARISVTELEVENIYVFLYS